MNAENFTGYLENTSQLYQLSYQELKSLSMAYPYAVNIHILLLLKSKMIDHEDFEKNLVRAATYAPDRAHLFTLLQGDHFLHMSDPSNDTLVAQEGFLELKNLRELEEQLPNVIRTAPAYPLKEEPALKLSFESPAAEPPPPFSAPVQPHLPLSAIMADAAALVRAQAAARLFLRLKADKEATAPPLLMEPHALLQRLKKNAQKATAPNPDASYNDLAPTPKKSFASWIQQFQSDHIRQQMRELMEAQKQAEEKAARKKAKKQAGQGPEVDEMAQRSVAENDEMASETLAKLLVAQQQYTKAIEVYERLILIFPQKSSLFAAKIEELKKIIA